MAALRLSLVPLESGDHLAREEFHRRYCARPDIARAELIEGVVYVSSPTSASHGEPHAAVVGWLYVYKARRPELRLADNTTVFIDEDSEVQPDACLYRGAPTGRVRVIDGEEGGTRTTYLAGAPELIVEVAASSASYDLHSKKRVYERAGVREYVVWQVYERRIDWFALHGGAYVLLEPDARGVIESEVFPGLRLAREKMLAGDDAGVLAELVARDR